MARANTFTWKDASSTASLWGESCAPRGAGHVKHIGSARTEKLEWILELGSKWWSMSQCVAP
jgi:hypothetical protein